MAEKTEHNEINEIFNEALELEINERQKFLNEACKNKPKLRERVESLLSSFENSLDFIEKPIVEVSQISPFIEEKTLVLKNAEQFAAIAASNKIKLKSSVPPPHVLRGDLDNIILMALRKEPSRRYSTVEEFSKDISNYLSGIPISARPNTYLYRASKFFQRNKTASIVGLFLVLSLTFGIIATAWQSVIARQQRDRAEKRFQDVRKLSNSLLFEITPNIEKLNGSTKTREILVKRALEYLDSLANESSNDLTLQSELASAYEKVGELQLNPNKPSLNDTAGAIESYQKAQTIRNNLPETSENQQLLAENLRNYSDIIFAQNDVNGSLNISIEAIKIYEKLLAGQPQSFELKTSLIETQMDFGATYSTNNQYSEAIPIFQKAIADLALLDQNNLEVKKLTALALAQLGNALSWNNKQNEAEIEMAKAVEITDSLVEQNPNDNVVRRQAYRVYTLASGIYEEVKNDISLEFAQKAFQIANRAVEIDSADLMAKTILARAYSKVGISLVNTGNISQAIENLQKAENLFRDLITQEPNNLSYQRNVGILHQRLGDVKTLQNKYFEALTSYQESAKLFENIAKTDEKNTLALRDQAQSLKNVGEMQIKLNQKLQAKQTFQKALEILTNLKSKNALGEVDQKMIEKMQTVLQKL